MQTYILTEFGEDWVKDKTAKVFARVLKDLKMLPTFLPKLTL